MVEEQNTKLGAVLRERRRIAEQLRRSQERYRALVETAFAGISMTDSDERLTFVNQGLCELLGYEEDELQGKSLSELTDPDEFRRYTEYTQRRQKGLRNYYETRMHHKNGSPLNILISASPLTAADGSFEGTIAVIIDITELRRTEANLEEAKRAYTENLEDTVKERTRALDLAQAQLIQSEKGGISFAQPYTIYCDTWHQSKPLACEGAWITRPICRSSTGSSLTRRRVLPTWRACGGLTVSCARSAGTPAGRGACVGGCCCVRSAGLRLR